MPKLNIQVDFPDDQWQPFLDSLGPMSVLLAPAGIYLYKICDAVSQGQPLRIVEMGCLRNADPSAIIQDGWSTFYFAKWVKDHPGSTFNTVELDPVSVDTCGKFIKQQNLDKFVTFWNFDSVSFLETWDQPVDVFFLDSCDGLDHGLEEFKAAIEFRPCTIIMDDYETKVKLADEYARNIGITSQRMDRYTVFQIPR
jgi:hypothetical protein